MTFICIHSAHGKPGRSWKDLSVSHQLIGPQTATIFFGDYILYSVYSTNDNWDTGFVSVSDTNKRTPLLQTRFDEGGARFSQDGRYIAYISNESGKNEVYVMRFPDGTGNTRISVNGGLAIRWVGNELFYVEENTNTLMAVSTTTARRLQHPVLSLFFQVRRYGVYWEPVVSELTTCPRMASGSWWYRRQRRVSLPP